MRMKTLILLMKIINSLIEDINFVGKQIKFADKSIILLMKAMNLLMENIKFVDKNINFAYEKQ